MVLTAITDTVRSGLRARAELLPALHAEGTDCYRLFHGATEGLPGCTLDRYGDLLLWQTFREPPDIDPAELLPALRELVADETGAALEVHYNARDKRQRANAGVDAIRATLAEDHTASELGLRYCIDAPAPGRDPFLYLDFRAARRRGEGENLARFIAAPEAHAPTAPASAACGRTRVAQPSRRSGLRSG